MSSAGPNNDANEFESNSGQEPPRDDADAPEPNATNPRYDPRYLKAAYKAVPEIGQGARWYDTPYRVLRWFLSSWRRRILPRKIRERLNDGLNWLHPFNEHDRHKAWSRDDRQHNVNVPEAENVTVPMLWVVELFPPSQYHSLLQAIEANSWDRRRAFRERGNNVEMLRRSRARSGGSWWRLAEIADVDSKAFNPDGTRERLPEEFTFVELRAVQIGSGVTAVVGRFSVSESASRHLNEAWHTPHEPQLVKRRGQPPRAEDRQWARFRLTQEARKSTHDSAREWLARRCGGYFADAAEPQLLVELMLTDQFDPVEGSLIPNELRDAFRALGLTDFTVEYRTSKDMPGLLLSQVEPDFSPALGGSRAWALWGKRETVVTAASHLEHYGSDSDWAIAHRYDDDFRYFLIALAITEYLRIAQSRYAAMRDGARTGHRNFRPRALASLRESMLTQSMDLATLNRDVPAFWRGMRRMSEMAAFTVGYAPWIVANDEAAGRTPEPPYDWNSIIRKQQRKWLKQMTQADRDLRELLSTVAALGASADASRLGRMALIASLASLAVALVAVLVTDVRDGSILHGLSAWARSHF